MSEDKSRIRLRRNDAVFFFALATAALAGTVYFHLQGRMSGVLGCAGAALVLLCGALLLGGEATCPNCLTTLTGLSIAGWRPYALCGKCRHYVRCEGGRVHALEHEHLAPRAEFSVPVDLVKTLPESCCVCLKPASRRQELVYSAAVRHSPGWPTGKSMKFKVGAPYCDTHFDEAKLTIEDLAPFPGINAEMLVETTKTDEHFVLKVRSYGFYRAATRLA